VTLVVEDTCTACGLCVVTCPERALTVAPRKPRFVASRCTACLACVEVCPRDAIREVA
jgi:NAD-dependent dihydropyrimidine dehydrogenase PreA subunit